VDVAADLEAIRQAFRDGMWDFNVHGTASALKRGIKEAQITAAIRDDAPEVIEDYPADERGPACLILGWVDLARPLHIEVGYGNDPATWMDVITVYEPDERQWYNHRQRR
jgi:hypothetical protein